jgi:hypothetical protein
MNLPQKNTRETEKEKREIPMPRIEFLKYISFVIFSAGIFIFGINFFLQYASEVFLFPKIKNWESIPCKIKEITINVGGGKERYLSANVIGFGGTSASSRNSAKWIDVLYEYQWEGKKYTSSRLTVRSKKKYYDGSAEKILMLKKNILNKQICKINPENPEESILFPEIPPDKNKILNGFVFSLIGAILLFFIRFFKNKKYLKPKFNHKNIKKLKL